MASLDDVLKHLRAPPVPERPDAPEDLGRSVKPVGAWFADGLSGQAVTSITDFSRGFSVDLANKKHIVMFGKYKGQSLEEIATTFAGRGYLRWLVETVGEKRPELVEVCKMLLPPGKR